MCYSVSLGSLVALGLGRPHPWSSGCLARVLAWPGPPCRFVLLGRVLAFICLALIRACFVWFLLSVPLPRRLTGADDLHLVLQAYYGGHPLKGQKGSVGAC